MRELQIPLPKNRNPWEVDFSVRIAEYLNDSDKRHRVVTIYDAPNTTSFRYRVYNIKQALDDTSILLCYFYRYELKSIFPYLSYCSCLVLARCQWTLDIQILIDMAKALKIKVVYDVDDIICSLNHLRLVTNTLNVNLDNEVAYSFWSACIGRGQMVAAQCDCFIATNDFLGRCLSEIFDNKRYWVIENSLNSEQLSISHTICQQKKLWRKFDDFIIGYFSGTPSHINDFKVIAPEIKQILDDFPSAKLIVVGFMDFPVYLRKYIEEKRILFKPLLDFLELQIEMAKVDVSVVPLIENEFTNCKSELKYFEGAVVDTLTLATPIYTYAHSIVDGETGFLCRNGQWYSRIAEIIAGKYDTREITSAAKSQCLARYSGQGFALKAKKVFEEIMNY